MCAVNQRDIGHIGRHGGVDVRTVKRKCGAQRQSRGVGRDMPVPLNLFIVNGSRFPETCASVEHDVITNHRSWPT